MLKIQKVPIADIYVPTSHRARLDAAAAEALAEDILENGLRLPIHVRHDGKRHVLVEGLHRLEASRLLGETFINAYLVQAKRH